MKDYYEILGVSEKATKEEIKSAYRKLAKEYHPDRRQGDKQAEERFKDISEAYRVLSDEKRRAQYDQARRFQHSDFNFGQARNAGGFRNFAFENFDFSDLFGQFFGNRTSRASGIHTPPAQDLNAEITVPFETAVHGGKQLITLNREMPCERCKGSGGEAGGLQTCHECGGKGSVITGFGFEQPCPGCGGRGQTVKRACRSCGGRGVVQGKQKLSVNIPAGIGDGRQIRLKGHGTGARTQGDLFITVRVSEHPKFKRKGLDIFVDADINMVQAALGTRIKVTTVYSDKLEIKIPAGTQPGKVFKLGGRGVKYKGRTGDQYVTVRVSVPEFLNSAGQAALKKFADTAGISL